jgi:hypothetical protein
MFNNRSRGPKPSKWTHSSRARFIDFFARRSGEPLNMAESEAPPLFEASAAGRKWLFTGFGDGEPTQVQAALNAPVYIVAMGVTGAFAALGTGAVPGEGTCERYWVVDEVEVQEGVPLAMSRVRGGTGDLQLQLPNGHVFWCSGHHCRPWQLSDEPLSSDEAATTAPARPPSPQSPAVGRPAFSSAPSPSPPASSDAAAAEAATAAERLARQTKHVRMRDHLKWLMASTRCSVTELAENLGVRRQWLGQ